MVAQKPEMSSMPDILDGESAVFNPCPPWGSTEPSSSRGILAPGRFEGVNSFPQPVQDRVKGALAIAAAGSMADMAKPMKGFDAGVYEISKPTGPMRSGRSMRSNLAPTFGWFTPSRRSRPKASRRRNARSTSSKNASNGSERFCYEGKG